MSSLIKFCEENFETDDLYAALKVKKDASEGELKRAYHKQALVYHPDRVEGTEKEDATVKFQVLGKIYSVLSDKEKRAIYDESGKISDEDEERDWDQYWRNLYPKITIEDIRNFEKNYKGSDAEYEDLKSAYEEYKGDMDKIMESVLCCTVDDEPRFHDLLTEWIKTGEIISHSKFVKEPKAKKMQRKKRMEKEAKEADDMRKEMNMGKDLDDLKAAIAKRGEERAKIENAFLDNLEEKYAKKPPKGTKKAKAPAADKESKPKRGSKKAAAAADTNNESENENNIPEQRQLRTRKQHLDSNEDAKERVPPKKSRTGKTKASKEATPEPDEDEPEEKPKGRRGKTAAKKESEDEDSKPKSKARAGKRKAAKDEEMEVEIANGSQSDFEEEPKPKSKAKSSQDKGKKEEKDGSDAIQSDVEDLELLPRGKKAPAKKRSVKDVVAEKKEEEAESDENSLSIVLEKNTKTKAKAGRGRKAAESKVEESGEDPIPAVKSKAKSGKGRKAVSEKEKMEVNESEDDEREEKVYDQKDVEMSDDDKTASEDEIEEQTKTSKATTKRARSRKDDKEDKNGPTNAKVKKSDSTKGKNRKAANKKDDVQNSGKEDEGEEDAEEIVPPKKSGRKLANEKAKPAATRAAPARRSKK